MALEEGDTAAAQVLLQAMPLCSRPLTKTPPLVLGITFLKKHLVNHGSLPMEEPCSPFLGGLPSSEGGGPCLRADASLVERENVSTGSNREGGPAGDSSHPSTTLEILTLCCCASLEHLDAAEAPFMAPRPLGEGFTLRKSHAHPKEDGHCPK